MSFEKNAKNIKLFSAFTKILKLKLKTFRIKLALPFFRLENDFLD